MLIVDFEPLQTPRPKAGIELATAQLKTRALAIQPAVG